jgi:hypothetical protein
MRLARLRVIASIVLLLIIHSQSTDASAQPGDSQSQHTVMLLHWYATLLANRSGNAAAATFPAGFSCTGASRGPGGEFTSNPVGSGAANPYAPSSPVNPQTKDVDLQRAQLQQAELRHNYEIGTGTCALVTRELHFRDSPNAIPPEIAGLITSEMSRLVQSLPTNDAGRMKGWRTSSASCSNSDVLWVGIQTGIGNKAGNLCVSGVLARALFLMSAGDTLVFAYSRLVSWGVDISSFDGTIPSSIAQKNPGMTTADFDAVLAAMAVSGESVWQKFVQSLDFAIAHEMVHVYLITGPGQQNNEKIYDIAAAALVKKANGAADLSSLQQVLIKAFSKDSPDPWGFESLGDARDVLTGIQSIP